MPFGSKCMHFFPLCGVTFQQVIFICISFGYIYISRSGIFKLQKIHMFSFSRHCQIVFQCRSNNLNSHQQCMRTSVPLYPHQSLVFSNFFMLVILVGGVVISHCALICISSVVNYVEFILMQALAILHPLLESVHIFCPFSIELSY